MAKNINFDIHSNMHMENLLDKEALLKKLNISEEEISKLGKVEKIYNKYYNNDVEPSLYLNIVTYDPTTVIKNDSNKKVEPIYHAYKKNVKVKASEYFKDKKQHNINNDIVVDNDGYIEKTVVSYLMLESGIKKLGEYSRWLVTNVMRKNILEEDLEDAKESLTVFHRFKDNIKKDNYELSDINRYNCLSYRGISDNENPILDVILKYEKPKDFSDENVLITNRYYITEKGADVFFENDEWLCVIPKTPEASAFYANNTKWCTRHPNQFERYNKNGHLYIFIDKTKLNNKDSMRRLQFQFESSSYMDINDSSITHSKYKDVTEWFDKYDWVFFQKEKHLIKIKLKKNLINLKDNELDKFILSILENVKDYDEKLKILNYLSKTFVKNIHSDINKIDLLKKWFPEQNEYLDLKYVQTDKYNVSDLENYFNRISNLKKEERDEILSLVFKKAICDYNIVIPYFRKEGIKYVLLNVINSLKYFSKDVINNYIEDMKKHMEHDDIIYTINKLVDIFDNDDNDYAYNKVLDSFTEKINDILITTEESLKIL